MLVYGDHERMVDPRAELDRLGEQWAVLPTLRGLERHQACTRLFIVAAELTQGLADAEFATMGVDEGSLLQAEAMRGLRVIADTLHQSWNSALADQRWPPALSLEGFALPASVTIRRCEGYAYYALYPELYLAAARRVPKGAVVIGLRSIGTGLAALVAAVCDAAFICTVRPIGGVFERTIALGPGLATTLQSLKDRPFVLVDEGPGQSGSSLGGAADRLEALGIPRADMIFMPSHDGDLGPHASPDHRARWAAASRLTARFEEVIEPHLASWFADLIGVPIALIEPCSGGAWRALTSAADAPVDPNREARKYRLTTDRGRFLLKFAGLDAGAAEKFGRARALYETAFGAEPLALRHGFLLERWVEGDIPASEPAIVAALPDYLAFRARAFAAPRGASLDALAAMARHNLADVPDIHDLFARFDTAALQRRVRPVHVDSRLHRWEWIAGANGLVKTDALDHAQGHDLVGPQDIAWDIAGAIAEYAIADPAALMAAAMRGRPEAEALVAFMLPCYLGFQRGWWHYAPEGAEVAAVYAAKAAALVQHHSAGGATTGSQTALALAPPKAMPTVAFL